MSIHFNIIKNHNIFFWLSAIVIGSILNVGLFFILYSISRTEPINETSIIATNFMAWEKPVEEPLIKSKAVVKKKPEPIKKEKPKAKVKPVKKPQPKPIKKPVLTEKVTDVKKKPEIKPIEKPEPILEEELIKEEIIEEEPIEDQSLPIPTPMFKLSDPPRELEKGRPIYPPSMRGTGQTVIVNLELFIDVRGRVRRVKIIKSGGDAFDEAATSAALKWKYLPGNIKGRPVAVIMKRNVRFSLD